MTPDEQQEQIQLCDQEIDRLQKTADGIAEQMELLRQQRADVLGKKHIVEKKRISLQYNVWPDDFLLVTKETEEHAFKAVAGDTVTVTSVFTDKYCYVVNGEVAPGERIKAFGFVIRMTEAAKMRQAWLEKNARGNSETVSDS